jgi:hypothetical protein
VSPRAGMDAATKRKNHSPCRESSPTRPARSPVTVLTELSLFLLPHISLYKQGNQGGTHEAYCPIAMSMPHLGNVKFNNQQTNTVQFVGWRDGLLNRRS